MTKQEKVNYSLTMITVAETFLEDVVALPEVMEVCDRQEYYKLMGIVSLLAEARNLTNTYLNNLKDKKK